MLILPQEVAEGAKLARIFSTAADAATKAPTQKLTTDER
jgi:hypothetical protein